MIAEPTISYELLESLARLVTLASDGENVQQLATEVWPKLEPIYRARRNPATGFSPAEKEALDENGALDQAALKHMELEMLYTVPLCTHVVNRKIIYHGTKWGDIGLKIATGAGIKVKDVPNSLIDRLYNSEDVFFDLRMHMKDDLWLSVYEEMLDAGMLIHASEDNPQSEVVEQSPDSQDITQAALSAHWVKPGTTRADVAECIGYAIEGNVEWVLKDLRKEVTAVLQSRDVLLTLVEVLPHCEWFEVYRQLLEEGHLESSDTTLRRGFTSDGYTFHEQADGSWQDAAGDMSWPNYGEMSSSFDGEDLHHLRLI